LRISPATDLPVILRAILPRSTKPVVRVVKARPGSPISGWAKAASSSSFDVHCLKGLAISSFWKVGFPAPSLDSRSLAAASIRSVTAWAFGRPGNHLETGSSSDSRPFLLELEHHVHQVGDRDRADPEAHP
jgi:hypothetical protein